MGTGPPANARVQVLLLVLPNFDSEVRSCVLKASRDKCRTNLICAVTKDFSGEFVGTTKRLNPFRNEFFFDRLNAVVMVLWDHTVKPKYVQKLRKLR